MFGITLLADEIKAAPSDVRRWLEQEIASTLYPAEAASKHTVGQTSVVEQALASQGDVKMSPAERRTTDEEIRNLIAVRAYELWENQGRPSCHDLINWHEAEEEIMSCIENVPGPADSHDAKGKSPPPGPTTERLATSDALTAAAGEI